MAGRHAAGRTAPALTLAILLAGCTDYANRRDSVTLRAGNAASANRSIQTVEPFPAAAFTTQIDADGNRVLRGASRVLGPAAGPAAGASGGDAGARRAGGGGGAAGGGNCDRPTDRAADGTLCGDRAASERPGGR